MHSGHKGRARVTANEWSLRSDFHVLRRRRGTGTLIERVAWDQQIKGRLAPWAITLVKAPLGPWVVPIKNPWPPGRSLPLRCPVFPEPAVNAVQKARQTCRAGYRRGLTRRSRTVRDRHPLRCAFRKSHRLLPKALRQSKTIPCPAASVYLNSTDSKGASQRMTPVLINSTGKGRKCTHLIAGHPLDTHALPQSCGVDIKLCRQHEHCRQEKPQPMHRCQVLPGTGKHGYWNSSWAIYWLWQARDIENGAAASK